MEAMIKDYMIEQPHTINPKLPLTEARKMMQRYKIRHLPVVENKTLVGLISERDFALIYAYENLDLEQAKVEDLMLQELYWVKPTVLLKHVVGDMAKKKIGAALVVDDDNRVIGIFTAIDALTLLSKIYEP